MNKEEVYSVWAPEGCVWSRWVKPILFAYITDATPQLANPEPEDLGKSVPMAPPDTGLVIDLDGPQGVFLGMRLARRGYRPIPLYNACPQPQRPAAAQPGVQPGSRMSLDRGGPKEHEPVVDVNPIVSALAGSTDGLRRLNVPWSAPPAFLLDARRRGRGKKVKIGMFDNRSVVFPSDLPSAGFLKDRGIRSMIVMTGSPAPQFDLAAVFREWEAAGMDIRSQRAGLAWAPAPLELPVPSWVRRVWFWLQTHLGLERNISGGYGRIRRGGG